MRPQLPNRPEGEERAKSETTSRELRIAHINQGGVQIVVSHEDVPVVFIRLALKLFVELCEGILARVGKVQLRILFFFGVGAIFLVIPVKRFSIPTRLHANATGTYCSGVVSAVVVPALTSSFAITGESEVTRGGGGC